MLGKQHYVQQMVTIVTTTTVTLQQSERANEDGLGLLSSTACFLPCTFAFLHGGLQRQIRLFLLTPPLNVTSTQT